MLNDRASVDLPLAGKPDTTTNLSDTLVAKHGMRVCRTPPSPTYTHVASAESAAHLGVHVDVVPAVGVQHVPAQGAL